MKKFLLLVAAMLVAGVSVQAQEVTPPAKAQIEKYKATGWSYVFSRYGVLDEWEAQVAISGNQMYVKDILPYMQNTKWVVGTISNGKVVFTGGQPFGEQDQTLYGGDEKYTDCTFWGFDEDFSYVDASFSWDEATKTLRSIDYEVGSVTEIGGGANDAYDGWSDPDCTLKLVGTGEYVGPSTAINDIKVESNKAYKTIENGQMVIVRGDAKYNVAGQLIK